MSCRMSCRFSLRQGEWVIARIYSGCPAIIIQLLNQKEAGHCEPFAKQSHVWTYSFCITINTLSLAGVIRVPRNHHPMTETKKRRVIASFSRSNLTQGGIRFGSPAALCHWQPACRQAGNEAISHRDVFVFHKLSVRGDARFCFSTRHEPEWILYPKTTSLETQLCVSTKVLCTKRKNPKPLLPAHFHPT